MKQMKKMILTLILVLSVFVFLSCGKKSEISDGPSELKIAVWTRIGSHVGERWRADAAIDAAEELNKELAAEGKTIKVVIESVKDEGNWAEFKKKFAMAAENSQGPDIICSGHEDIPVYANAGYIVPIADSVSDVKSSAPEYDDVIESLWNCTIWNGKVWAVPQDTEARPMFYSKLKLKELGWSDSKIENLPAEIKAGNFTLEDMINVSVEAIEKGVVKPGFGYWHRPRKGGDFIQYYAANGGAIYDEEADKLVISRTPLLKWFKFQRECVTSGITPEKYIGIEWKIWHDTVANNNALFWNGGIWQWSDWASNYVEGGEEALFENVGYALQPAAEKGGKAVTLSHPLVYMVTSKKTSGQDKQDIVKRLVQKMTTAELNTRHALESSHIGILKSQLEFPAYKEAKFLSSVTYMVEENFYQPNHIMYGLWFDIVWEGMLAAEQGDKTPEKAVEDVIKLLEMELGDSIIIR